MKNPKLNSILFKVMKGALSVFHGPLFESCFSKIGNVMDAHSANVNIRTLDSFQTIQYSLRCHSSVSACEETPASLT